MKKFYRLYLFVLLTSLSYSGFSQQKYVFTDIKVIATTPVKNQYRSGTCWSFSTTSFVETELIRKGKGEFDLSEMYPVRYTYHQRAIDYVRYQGHLNFSGGAQSWLSLLTVDSPTELNIGKSAIKSYDLYVRMRHIAIGRKEERCGYTIYTFLEGDAAFGAMNSFVGIIGQVRSSHFIESPFTSAFNVSIGIAVDHFLTETFIEVLVKTNGILF